ncbi:succinylglutamate desuccinylase [Ventosimonas gracilis]|uniref:Succinylglutamate desuccinylase n=1 Tax=Ventosimonas gracilis TaxID=1680762 RepID=A0A139SQP4_9GAMM|nr:succinylglutamate desuccinylase [Ventosimonas gracilis]KXU36771.1 succinylglutamate desuccinylase [Ventosimonas gracilis]
MSKLADLLQLTLQGIAPVYGNEAEPADDLKAMQTAINAIRLHWLGEGVLQLSPAPGDDRGLSLLLSAGIHGNETAPVELLDQLLKRILMGELRLRCRLLVVFGNPQAMRQGVRYIEQDLNRLFNGRHKDSQGFEAKRAASLERFAADFFRGANLKKSLHYDLHTAIRGSKIEQFALYPFAENRLHSRAELKRLQSAGISAVLLQNRPATTFTAYSYAQLGVEAITLELGKARPFGQNQEINLQKLQSVIERLIEGDESHPPDAFLDGLQLFTVSREIIKQSDHFRLHLSDNIENFSPLKQYSLLAEDGDMRWQVDEANARIIFPNAKVQNGQRAGLIIVPAAQAI